MNIGGACLQEQIILAPPKLEDKINHITTNNILTFNVYVSIGTQNMIFCVWLYLVFYHPTLLNTNFQFFDN